MSLQDVYDRARFSPGGFDRIDNEHMKWRVLGPSEGPGECGVCKQTRQDTAHFENVKSKAVLCKRCYVDNFEFK